MSLGSGVTPAWMLGDLLPYSVVVNGIEFEVRATSMEHARRLLWTTLPKSEIDWSSLKEKAA